MGIQARTPAPTLLTRRACGCTSAFVSKPEIQKLNRNSIYIFVNGRLIRDRLIQHALTEAYRNIHSADGLSRGAAVSRIAEAAKWM